jgi:RNA polymerase sigma-70 factor (ECF subfamily)
VRKARDASDSEAHRALEELCQTYWQPRYAFVRRQGYDRDAACDLTQAYFAELLDKDFLKAVHSSAGRFRSFLLASLKHFLSHQRDRERALKRGGGAHKISLDSAGAEERLGSELADRLTPEEIFEHHWALTVLERAMERLRRDEARAGREQHFETFQDYLTGGAAAVPYREVALDLGMSEAAVRKAVVRLRKRFGRVLRAEILHTVADPDEADDEIRHLLTVIQPWQGTSGKSAGGHKSSRSRL